MVGASNNVYSLNFALQVLLGMFFLSQCFVMAGGCILLGLGLGAVGVVVCGCSATVT